MTPEIRNKVEPLWTEEEVATYLRVEVSTVRKWAKMRKIPTRKAGSLNRFHPREIDAWTRGEKIEIGTDQEAA